VRPSSDVGSIALPDPSKIESLRERGNLMSGCVRVPHVCPGVATEAHLRCILHVIHAMRPPVGSRRCLRNEKVRGSSPLSSTHSTSSTPA
jgi:hypothetical protein